MWISKRLWEFLERELALARQALAEERGRADRLSIELRGLRLLYDRQVTTLRVGHAAATARAQEAEQQRAVSQANLEWLASHVNAVEQNRAMLEARLLNTNPVHMQIDTSKLREDRHQPTTTRVDGEMAGTPELDQPVEEMPEFLKGQQSIFEDIGDEAARRLGLSHDSAGAVVTAR